MWPRGWPPASTSSSSTPATTSSRRSAPATPSTATMPVNVVTLSPTISVRQQDEQYGPDLWQRDPDLCCALRKVQPLTDGLAPYDAWATGLRREETHNRVIAPVVGWDEKKRKVKVSPLARWTARRRRPLHRRERHLGQPPAVRRLPVDRLLALHPTRCPGRRRPERPLGRNRQDRMWNPLMSAPALIALAHGSRDARSARTVREIVATTKRLRPDLRDRAGFPRPRAPRPRLGRRPVGGQGAHRDRRRSAAADDGVPRARRRPGRRGASSGPPPRRRDPRRRRAGHRRRAC